MNEPDKAQEPSMEDILASIRQIIAEDPPGTVPKPDAIPEAMRGEDAKRGPDLGRGGLGAGEALRDRHEQIAKPAQTNPIGETRSPSGTGSHRGDVQGGASQTSGRVDQSPIGSQAPLVAPSGSQPQLSEARTNTQQASTGLSLPGHASKPQQSVVAPTTPKSESERSGLFGRLAEALREPATDDKPAPVVSEQPGILDRGLPGAPAQSARPGHQTSGAASGRARTDGGFGFLKDLSEDDGQMAADPAVYSEPSIDDVGEKPAAQDGRGERAPEDRTQSLGERLRDGLTAKSTPAKNEQTLKERVRADDSAPVKNEDAKSSKPSVVLPGTKAPEDNVRPPRPVLGDKAAAKPAQDAPAAGSGSKAKDETEAAEHSAKATPSAPVSVTKTADAESAAPKSTGKEEVADDAAADPAEKAITGLSQLPAEAGGVKTLEDTVSELLRPLLREWLENNMPRIVEKALRVEVAESVKALSQAPSPSKGDKSGV